MQLNGTKSLRQAVVALTAGLLGTGAVSASEQGTVESSILLYSETNRVQAAEAVAGIRWNLSGGRVLTGKLTFDALSGASPNGASPSNRVQTFTRPSGRGQYSVQPGETPLDDTFHDARFAVDASLSQPLNRLTAVTFGGHFSSEYDYLSLGANAGITRELNKKNTTLELSGAFSYDRISPEGGIPEPYAAMVPAGSRQPRIGDSDAKTVFDAVFGVTQVIDRQTMAQFNYSISRASGYLTDPFKILSVVASPESADAGEPISYLFESRPDSRTKQAFFVRSRRYLGGNTVDASYRFFFDDWGITSHTADLFYRQNLGRGHAVQPHLRWYHQSSADFYRSFLVADRPLPENASADCRLASFDAYTVGLQYFLPVMGQVHLSLTGEYYSQRGDRSPPEAFGALRDLDLFPNLDVFMIRLGCSYDL